LPHCLHLPPRLRMSLEKKSSSPLLMRAKKNVATNTDKRSLRS